MRISRRNFLTLLASSQALSGLPINFHLTGDPDELVHVPESDVFIDKQTFVSTKKSVIGPASIFDIITSFDRPLDLAGKILLLRDQEIIMELNQNFRAMFRWVAAPGGEIVVPKGSSLTLKLAEVNDGHGPLDSEAISKLIEGFATVMVGRLPKRPWWRPGI